MYSQAVGVFEDYNYRDKPFFEELVWDVESQEYISIYCNPKKMWENPFTGVYEHIPKEIREPDQERSLQVSMNRTIKKVYHLARSNLWEWFFTLTFDPQKIDSYDYAACTKALSDWLHNLRRIAPDLAYIVVPEHHKSGRFHFHGLFAHCGNISFVESGHFTKSGDMIYNVGSYRLGFSTATRIKSNEKVTKYISKYITKDLCCLSRGKKRYWASRNLIECEEEHLLYDSDQLHSLLAMLNETCTYKKMLQSGDLTTTYFEMGEPME